MYKDALGRRHAVGQREGGEGHTSYDSLPKGACRIVQDFVPIQHAAGPSAKGGGFKALRLMPPTPFEDFVTAHLHI